jgi:hypothetical protein
VVQQRSRRRGRSETATYLAAVLPIGALILLGAAVILLDAHRTSVGPGRIALATLAAVAGVWWIVKGWIRRDPGQTIIGVAVVVASLVVGTGVGEVGNLS